MSEVPSRSTKLFSTAECEQHVSFGWSVTHALREAPQAEPYEYILEWTRPGLPLRPAHWGDNWLGVATGGPQAEGLVAELRRELGPGHPLFGRRLLPMARCPACDEVLFQSHPDGGYVLVHLTWTQLAGKPPWPRTQSLASEAEIAGAMSGHEH